MSLRQELLDFAHVYEKVHSSTLAPAERETSPKELREKEVWDAYNSAYADWRPTAIPVSTTGNVTQVGNKPNSGSQLPALVMNELLSRKIAPDVAAGAVGSLMGESGRTLDPRAYNPDDKGAPSGGFAQWRGPRLNGLYSFAGASDLSKIPAEVQAKYLGHELDTTHAHVRDALRQARGVASGNEIWTRQFEVPANVDEQVRLRLPRGMDFYKTWLPATPPAHVSGFLDGGMVQRPDQVASPQQGIDIGVSDRGARPGGALAGLADAVRAGVEYLDHTFEFNRTPLSAIPSNADGAKIRQFHATKATAADYRAATDAVDPEKQMPEALRNALALNSIYHFFLQRGEPGKAREVAAGLIMYAFDVSTAKGKEALKDLGKGEIEQALEAIDAAHSAVPHGVMSTSRPTANRGAIITQFEAITGQSSQYPVSIEGILQEAQSLADGSWFWTALSTVSGYGAQSANDICQQEFSQ